MSSRRKQAARDEGAQPSGAHWKLIAIVAVVVAGYLLLKPLLPHFDLQKVLDDVARTLGSWTYLLVAALAFGETGAFIGLFLPGEVAVILGGAVAGQGAISLPLILAVSWLAAFLGDTTGFTIGRRFGRGVLKRHGPRVGITRERFAQVEKYFAKHGGKTIVIGRFISFVRPLAPFMASGSGMRYRDFAPYSVIGTGLWATAFVLLGYFGARSIDSVAKAASRGSFFFGVAVVTLAATWVAIDYLRREDNRRRLVAWLEQHRVLKPLVPFGRRLKRPARFAIDRLRPGQGLGLEFTTVLAVLAVSSFVLISYTAVIAADPSPTPGDRTAVDIARNLQAGWLTAVAKAITQLGAAYVTIPIALIAAVMLAVRSRWAEFWVLVIGMTVLVIGNAELKQIIGRPRPLDGLVSAPGKAFPSGHAAHSVLYVWLGVTLSIRLRPGLPRGTLLILAGIVVAGLVGLTRIYLGVHYFSDVAGGWALGAASFSLCALIALLVANMRQNGPHARRSNYQAS